MEIKIRPASLDDCETCALLSRIEEHEAAAADYLPSQFFAANVDDDEMFIVAELDGEVVGYILGQPMKGEYAYLSLLAVDSSMRGKGIGRLLVDAFLTRCLEKSLPYVILYTPSFNEGTLAFYRSRGFEQGREHVEFGMRLEIALS